MNFSLKYSTAEIAKIFASSSAMLNTLYIFSEPKTLRPPEVSFSAQILCFEGVVSKVAELAKVTVLAVLPGFVIS